MSGIAGLVANPNNPLDPALLRRLGDSIRFRGPDRQGLWSSPEAGLVHSLLATTTEAAGEQLPLSFGNALFLTADCRIDAQQELRAALVRLGRHVPPSATDPELILHAYAAWDVHCVQHLLGDFSFAIWDAPRRRLFCARDHSGVKPFFYANTPSGFVFGNTLASIRLHPEVSDRLNDLAILDYFLFGLNQEPDTTAYAAIHALPPASCLTWEDGRLNVSRYWVRPIEEPLFYRKPTDYVDHFQSLLDTAVRDRLRTPKLSVQMSGGLDSTLLAATAKRVGGPDLALHAYSICCNELIEDRESEFTAIAANHLAIPLHLIDGDTCKPFDGFPEIVARSPQPINQPLFIHGVALLRSIASHSRVFFYGEGPDNLLRYEWKSYLHYLRRQRSLSGLALAVCHSLWLDPRLPLAKAVRPPRPAPIPQSGPVFPAWLQPEMVARHRLRERWDAYWSPLSSPHPYHPNSYASMSIANWTEVLNSMDPGVSGIPAEPRHPFLDLRLARFLLSLPVIPWCRRKLILRQAASRCLPKQIWARQKTYLAADPLQAHARAGTFPQQPAPSLDECGEYVTHWPPLDLNGSWNLFYSTSPIALRHWLAAQRSP